MVRNSRMDIGMNQILHVFEKGNFYSFVKSSSEMIDKLQIILHSNPIRFIPFLRYKIIITIFHQLPNSEEVLYIVGLKSEECLLPEAKFSY